MSNNKKIYWCGCGQIYDTSKHIIEIVEKNKKLYKREFCCVFNLYKDTLLKELKKIEGVDKTFSKYVK